MFPNTAPTTRPASDTYHGSHLAIVVAAFTLTLFTIGCTGGDNSPDASGMDDTGGCPDTGVESGLVCCNGDVTRAPTCRDGSPVCPASDFELRESADCQGPNPPTDAGNDVSETGVDGTSDGGSASCPELGDDMTCCGELDYVSIEGPVCRDGEWKCDEDGYTLTESQKCSQPPGGGRDVSDGDSSSSDTGVEETDASDADGSSPATG